MRPCLRLLFTLAGLVILAALLTPSALAIGSNIPPQETPRPTPDPAVQAPPYQPKAVEPLNGAIIRTDGEFVVLRSSAFRDPNPPETPNGTHQASQWVVYTEAPVMIAIYPPPPGAITVVVDSGPTSENLVEFKVAKTLLRTGQKYFWKVRHCDASGDEATQWSPWSAPAAFALGTAEPTPDPNVNRPPLQPAAVEPLNGAVIRTDSEYVLLRSSAFRDPNPPETPNGTHRASQWVVYTQADVTIMIYPPPPSTNIIVLESGVTTENLVEFKVPKRLLTAGKKYFWKVRHCDASGVAATQWSPWSLPAAFVLGTPPPDPNLNRPPLQPTALEPGYGAVVRPVGEFITLRASAFRDPNPPETPNGRHKFSHWQVYIENPPFPYPTLNTDPANGFAPVPPREIILDSGPTDKPLTIFLLPAKLLKSGTTYYWTVRYCDASGVEDTQWSPWSIPAAFATPAQVIKNLKPALKTGPAKPGASIYSDKLAPIILRLPQTLWSQYLIRPRSSDARTSGPGTLISFSSDLPVSVIVAYDDRATTLPRWLWAFKPYRPILPILMDTVVSNTGTGLIQPGAASPIVRGGDISILPLPPDRIPPGIWKMEVSDREAPQRRLLYKEFAANQAIGLGNNLPAPGVDTRTTVSLRMYGVIVQPKWTRSITPLPELRPTAGVKAPTTNTGGSTGESWSTKSPSGPILLNR